MLTNKLSEAENNIIALEVENKYLKSDIEDLKIQNTILKLDLEENSSQTDQNGNQIEVLSTQIDQLDLNITDSSICHPPQLSSENTTKCRHSNALMYHSEGASESSLCDPFTVNLS